MNLTKEPNIETKIRKMNERVKWKHTNIKKLNIDQTQLAIKNNQENEKLEEFSFLVLGDSGTGRHRNDSPQREVAKYVMAKGQDAHFVLHTGDVVYLVGSREQYFYNFIEPYREFLQGGENPKEIAYDQMIFKIPFFPVIGNHDYYDISPWLGLLSGLSSPFKHLFRRYIDLDVGWHGSFQGDAFARAFIDYLKNIPDFRLDDYLNKHYTTITTTGRCLTYEPGIFTRIPNRYYSFCYGGIEFFALDSNTFNQPQPLSKDGEDRELQKQLEQELQKLIDEKNLLLKSRMEMYQGNQDEEDKTEEITAEVEQLDEQINDINKQFNASSNFMVDKAQLNWLQQRLINSWENPSIRGRIIFFHHPPYVTEASKWEGRQTLAVRNNLRTVLDRVAARVGDLAKGRPLVNLVLSGHAHCLEYLRTQDTGHSDSHLNWIICGGSGYSLRRQRSEGSVITETMNGEERVVVENHLFVGRNGKGSDLRRPYSGLRIDVQKGTPPKLVVTPLVAEKYQKEWHNYSLDPLVL